LEKRYEKKAMLDDKSEGIDVLKSVNQPTSPNTAYTLRVYMPLPFEKFHPFVSKTSDILIPLGEIASLGG
jgi:hypothetical protein